MSPNTSAGEEGTFVSRARGATVLMLVVLVILEGEYEPLVRSYKLS